MSGHSANLIFFNKKKTGRPEHLLSVESCRCLDLAIYTDLFTLNIDQCRERMRSFI